MSGHTKGPWIVQTPADRAREDGRSSEWSENYPSGLRIRSHNPNAKRGEVIGYELCCMSGVNDCTLPNARLIAAAPELLSELKEAHRGLSMALRGIDSPDYREVCAEFLLSIEAAIAKAEGR